MKTAAVCIATYKREEGLVNLLGDIVLQKPPAGWEFEIRVVCNEPDVYRARFAALVHKVAPKAIVSFEPEQNIAIARNACIALAPADAFLFIDDDERPTPCWMRALLLRIDEKDVDAVFGPVIGRQHGHAPRWLERTGAFNKLGPRHDGPIQWQHTRTSSAAVKGHLLGHTGEWFDPSFGLSGGSDTELFRRLAAQGAQFVHERTALVYEDNAPNRCSWKGILKRRYKAGAVYGRMQLQDDPISAHSYLISRGGYGFCLILLGLIPLLFARPGIAFNGACRLLAAIGAWRGRKPNYTVVRYQPAQLNLRAA